MKTGEDFLKEVTEDEKEEAEGAKRMVEETHLKICHCRNYLEMLKMFLTSLHCQY